MVDRLWPDSTIVCIATGPSLTAADVDFCRSKARVIVVNDAYTLAPWADVLYACDHKWWGWHGGVKDFAGLKFSIKANPKTFPDVNIIRNMGRHGVSLDPQGVMTGHDSGYQAIGLAVLLGASRILLLGYDMQAVGGDHFFGHHRDRTKPPFAMCLKAYATLPAALEQAGVTIRNCSRRTALTMFRCQPLSEALTASEVAA